MNQTVEIFTRVSGDVAILSVKGYVSATTGEKLEEAYEKASTSGAHKLLFHFHEKDSYLNTGGMGILIVIAAKSREKQQTIRVVVNEHFRKIFDWMGLTKYVTVFSTEEEALKGF